jgi:hypothetical protein
MSKRLLPALHALIDSAEGFGEPPDPLLAYAELRAVLSVVRAAKKVKPYSKDWQGRCEPIWNALDRLDRVGK